MEERLLQYKTACKNCELTIEELISSQIISKDQVAYHFTELVMTGFCCSECRRKYNEMNTTKKI